MRTLLLGMIGFFLFSCASGMENTKIKQSDFHYKLANNYFFDRNIPMALKELDTSLKLNPKNEKAHFLLGFIMLGRKNYSSAILSFKKALEIKKDFFEARQNLGVAYLAIGKYQKAIETLKPLLYERLYTTPHIVYNNIGYAYEKMGKYVEALTYFKKAVFINPRFCLGFNNIGKVYVKLKDIALAKKYFNKALKKCPKYPEPYYQLGLIFEKEKNFALAKTYYNKCIKYGGESQIAERCQIRISGGF